VVKKKIEVIIIDLDKAVQIFQTPSDLAEQLAEDIVLMINESEKKRKSFTVALSGGSTPELLFSVLGNRFSKSVSWEYVHFFWGDERCVTPESNESNYGMTRRTLLDKILIPSANIHRIRGENDPYGESARYSSEIQSFTEERNGLPSFDMILLGLGEDGHTASIFPGNTELLTSDKICVVAVNPGTGQQRITITGRVINNAESVFFLVTGKKKAEIVENIFNKNSVSDSYPASFIVPLHGSLRWYLDNDAGSLLTD
jgi:6-phosphogluconolactonase